VEAGERPEEQGDVRERPGRDERDRSRRTADERGRELDRGLGPEIDRRLGQVRAVEPGCAVDVDGDPRLPDQGPVGAGRNRDVLAAEQRERPAGVERGERERRVPGARCDPEDVQAGRRAGERDRERVVMAGVAVDDDRPR
jgi:hypothetical protein